MKTSSTSSHRNLNSSEFSTDSLFEKQEEGLSKPTTANSTATNSMDAKKQENDAILRHDWSTNEILALFERPFHEILYQAHTIHRRYFDPKIIQLSTLLNIKSGGCTEDCKYCSQSRHHETKTKPEPLLPLEDIIKAAKTAKKAGATRFCMGAAWRQLRKADIRKMQATVKAVKDLGLETCLTLGMLSADQARDLKESGLDYYNHNIDTSEDYYKEIITTRSYQDRLDTLENVRKAGINVCSGGIIGMGETRKDRAGMLKTLANLPQHPGSVPINKLVPIPGTPLGDVPPIDPIEFVRTIAVARIIMPQSIVRLSAGRKTMDDQTQALCFFAGANSIFYGQALLTTQNNETGRDIALLDRLGLEPAQA